MIMQSVVDGNICKLFFHYSEEEQEVIAAQLEMSVCEVKRKILEINNMEFKSQSKKGEEQQLDFHIRYIYGLFVYNLILYNVFFLVIVCSSFFS